MEIKKTENKRNLVEFRSEITKGGIKLENVYINGRKLCCVGYVSEKDKLACQRAIQMALDTSENEFEAMEKLSILANLGDNEIVPDEEITVEGYEFLLSYEKRAAYDCGGNEIANCRELQCELAPEAIKTILIPRIKDYIENEEEYDEEE